MPLSRVCHLITSRSCTHHFSASCCNEAFKIATSSAAYLNNYFMLMGLESVYSHTFNYEQRKDCPVCGGESLEISIPKSWTVENLIEMLVERQDMCVPSPFVSCTPPAHLTSNQPNQEAIAVDANEADLLSSTAATRGSDTAKFGENGVGARRRWGGCNCNRHDSSIQPVLAHHVLRVVN
jgi:hypothetical protein